MWDFLKKSLAFGMGAAILTADKIKQFADEAVARGEMSTEEARKFVDDVTRRADEEKQTMQNWIRDQVAKIMRDAGAAEASRVETLENRVKALELRVAALETPEVETLETS